MVIVSSSLSLFKFLLCSKAVLNSMAVKYLYSKEREEST